MSNSGTSGKGGGNVYDQSANAFGGAGNMLQQAAGMYGNVNLGQKASTYNPAMVGAQGYNAAQTGGSGYKASLMDAASVADPSKIAQGMGKYMNPYTQDVINNSIADMNRITSQQNAQVGASAANAGAFGGSRHGLVEATNLAEGQRNIGDLSGQLRHQGFNTAAGLSAQDIANRMQTGQFNASLLQQANANNQGYQNQASQFGAANQMTANLANQAAQNQQRQYGADSRFQAGLANQGAKNQAGQFGAAAQNQRDLERAQIQLAAAGGLGALSPYAQGLGNDLFGVGQQINQNQMGAGGLQQQLMQQILSGASGQYNQFMGMPQDLLNMQLGALGMNPLQKATTTTSQNTPGLYDWASLIGQTAVGGWGKGGAK